MAVLGRFGRFLILIACYGLLQGVASQLSQSFVEEVASLFRSNVKLSNHFKTNELEKLHLDRIKKLKNKNLSQRHTFILRLPSTCDQFCHDLLERRFQAKDKIVIYRRMHTSYASVSTTIGVMDTLHEQIAMENHVSGERYIVAYTPMLPLLKVDQDVQTLLQSDELVSCPGFDIEIDGLTQSQLDEFITELTQSLEGYNDYFTFPYQENFDTYYLSQSLTPPGAIPQQSVYVPFRMTGRQSSCEMATVRHIIDKLTEFRQVLWITLSYSVTTSNRWVKGLCQSGTAYNSPLSDTPSVNLTGAGEVIGIADTGIDMFHCAFHDPYHSTPYGTINHEHRKVVQYLNYSDSAEGEGAHGSHVCGTAAGYSFLDYGDLKKWNGVASHAKIAFMDIQDQSQSSSEDLSLPTNLYTAMFTPQYQAGARIFSNSWGTSVNTYERMASDSDRFMFNFPAALLLYANGNRGLSGSRTVGAPATLKNGLGVGASLNDHLSWLGYGFSSDALASDALGGFSSRGPTYDGRMKPDLLAPGYYVTSAKGNHNATDVHCDVVGFSGTSMATPAAAGSAVLVRQYFTNGYYPSGVETESDGFIPSGSLIKAILITSSRPVGRIINVLDSTTKSISSTAISAYPSSDQGYGVINLQKVLNFGTAASSSPISLFVRGAANSSSEYYVALSSHQSHSYSFTTDSTAGVYSSNRIRITVSYTDYPSSSTSSSPLINTLTLSVTRQSTGDVLTPYAMSVGSTTLVVDITSPAADETYTVTVSANSLVVTQPYAIVITGVVNVLDATTSTTTTTTGSSGISTASQRFQELSTVQLTAHTFKYVAILTVLCVLLIGSSCYLYWLIRVKIHGNPFADEVDDIEVFEDPQYHDHHHDHAHEGGGDDSHLPPHQGAGDDSPHSPVEYTTSSRRAGVDHAENNDIEMAHRRSDAINATASGRNGNRLSGRGFGRGAGQGNRRRDSEETAEDQIKFQQQQEEEVRYYERMQRLRQAETFQRQQSPKSSSDSGRGGSRAGNTPNQRRK